MIDPASTLKLTTLWLLRDVREPVRVSHERWQRYLANRAAVVTETAREATRLGAEARAAVAGGWRPPARKGKGK